MSEIRAESPKHLEDDNKMPAKRTPSKRKTFLERACAEGEEILKSMGGNVENEGGRRMTRSSVKGSSATPPPPVKKAKISNTPSTRRGRPKKLEEQNSDEEKTELVNTTNKIEEDTTTSPKSPEKDTVDSVKKDPLVETIELNNKVETTKENNVAEDITTTTTIATNDVEVKNLNNITSTPPTPEKMEVDGVKDDVKIAEKEKIIENNSDSIKTDEVVKKTESTKIEEEKSADVAIPVVGVVNDTNSIEKKIDEVILTDNKDNKTLETKSETVACEPQIATTESAEVTLSN